MIRSAIVFLFMIFGTITKADSINSATITKNTLKALPNCIHYQFPTHFCMWVNQFGEINTTPVLDHYLPDLVVTVFSKPKDNPWLEINKILDTAGTPIEQAIINRMTGLDSGSGNHSFQESGEQNVIFKEVDVIGNPALSFMPTHGLLPSTATPWIPYFQSMTDSLLWRGLPPSALPEEGMALGLNVMHHIGRGITNWGGLYPHEGKVLADNDAKASSVIAFRGADLLTSHYQTAHICRKLSTECGSQCKAAPIQENSKETYFQMIYPVEQNECHILGEDESYSPNMINHNGAYVWVIWRHYEGCADGDGKYIGRT